MGTYTLVPADVHPDGSETPTYWMDVYTQTMHPATAFGGGDVTDDSDTTGYTLGAIDEVATGLHHTQSVTCRFELPSGSGAAVALLIKIRARVNAGWDTTDNFGVNWDWRNGLIDAGSSRFFGGNSSTWGDGRAPDSPTTPAEALYLLNSTFQWFTTGYGHPEAGIDMGDPSDAGFWVECDLYPGMAVALASGTFWLSISPFKNIGDGSTPIPMIDLSEIRLIVATLPTGAHPLRRFPRAGAMGPSRGTPRRLTRRPGTY